MSSNRIKRLFFLSTHRGCKENDIFLTTFAHSYLHNLTHEQIAIYESFLTENDVDLYNWITRQDQVPSQYDQIVYMIEQCLIASRNE